MQSTAPTLALAFMQAPALGNAPAETANSITGIDLFSAGCWMDSAADTSYHLCSFVPGECSPTPS